MGIHHLCVDGSDELQPAPWALRRAFRPAAAGRLHMTNPTERTASKADVHPTAIRPEELSNWLPGEVVAASDGRAWPGVKLRGYRCRPVNVELPPIQDFMIMAVRHGRVRMQRRTSGNWLQETMVPGDVSLLTRDVSSHWKTDQRIEVIHVYFDLPCVTRIGEEVFEQTVADVRLLDVLRTRDPILLHGALAIADELAWGEPGSSLYVESIVHQMCIHALRRYSTVSFRAPAASGKGLSASQARRATEFIEANLDRAMTLAELAAVVHLCRFHFLRQFKARFGITPHAYIVRRRVESAQALLARSTLSIEEIAVHTGFSDQAHLTRALRRHLGVTPHSYRLAVRG